MFDFCASTLPLLRAQRPALKLLIVGADPSPAVLRLGELPGVTVTGSVPDVRPYLRASALMVAPLNIARGTQNKILEAMAMGVPVVTSRIAAGGVDASPAEHFLVADDARRVREAILRVLDDPAERARLSRSGPRADAFASRVGHVDAATRRHHRRAASSEPFAPQRRVTIAYRRAQGTA